MLTQANSGQANSRLKNKMRPMGYAVGANGAHPMVINNLRAIAEMLSFLEGRWSSMARRIEQCALALEQAALRQDHACVASELAAADALLQEVRPSLKRWLS